MDKNDIWHHFAMPENGTHPKLFILNTKTMNRWMFLAFSKVEVPTTFGLDFQMDYSSFKRLQGICLQEKHKERKHLSASNVQFKTTNPSSFRGETAGTPNQSIGENHGFSVEQP